MTTMQFSADFEIIMPAVDHNSLSDDNCRWGLIEIEYCWRETALNDSGQ
jgi:hypothetical protein